MSASIPPSPSGPSHSGARVDSNVGAPVKPAAYSLFISDVDERKKEKLAMLMLQAVSDRIP